MYVCTLDYDGRGLEQHVGVEEVLARKQEDGAEAQEGEGE